MTTAVSPSDKTNIAEIIEKMNKWRKLNDAAKAQEALRAQSLTPREAKKEARQAANPVYGASTVKRMPTAEQQHWEFKAVGLAQRVQATGLLLLAAAGAAFVVNGFLSPPATEAGGVLLAVTGGLAVATAMAGFWRATVASDTAHYRKQWVDRWLEMNPDNKDRLAEAKSQMEKTSFAGRLVGLRLAKKPTKSSSAAQATSTRASARSSKLSND